MGRVLYETSGDISFLRVSADGAWVTFAATDRSPVTPAAP